MVEEGSGTGRSVVPCLASLTHIEETEASDQVRSFRLVELQEQSEVPCGKHSATAWRCSVSVEPIERLGHHPSLTRSQIAASTSARLVEASVLMLMLMLQVPQPRSSLHPLICSSTMATTIGRSDA